MFRRIGARLNAFAFTPVALNAVATTPASSSAAPQSDRRNPRRLNDNLQQVFEVNPRVDFRRIGKQIADGYFMRLQFTPSAVVLKHVAQSKSAEERSIYGGLESQLQLPSSTVGRMLAVLDGNMDECQVIGRQLQGVFKVGAQPNTYVLSCKGNGTAPGPKGQHSSNTPIKYEATEWVSEFDAGDAVLLQRFLKNSLHYMQGFYHSKQEE